MSETPAHGRSRHWEDSTRLFAIVDQFDAAWGNGARPALEDYLPADPEQRRHLLTPLIHIDLERRLTAGERARVEDYLERFPELAESDENILALAVAEYRIRQRPESGLPIDEYLQRFPQFADQIRTALANEIRQDQESPLPPTGSYDQVISLCESFAQEWQPQERPAFDDYLQQVAEDARPTLLRNLLHIEIQRRRAGGEQPSAEEYIHKFPKLAALIRQVFSEASSAVSSSHSDTADWKPAVVKGPAANRLGEYQLLRELGHGGMGTVYDAVHSRQGNRMALKTLPKVDGVRLHQFKREFRALADVNHPNLIGLHTLESDGYYWFFTMDLIDGVDLLSYVRPSGMLDLFRLRSALSQLVTAVLALHSQHIIHRDLKPANVLVTHEGRVIVLDFGLVFEQDQSWSTDRIAGTPRYMAPEQAAGGKITTACDWYAVGVMLYEALSGQAPFMGQMLQVLQAKQVSDPLALAPGPDIPEDLAALAMALLARDPGARPDARAIVKVVASQAESPGIGRPVSGPRLVGREQQMAALQDAYRALRKQRQPLTVFIPGRSGEGKTSLAEHFLEPLRKSKEEVVVMSGRCYDRESVPFKALDSLIDALGSYLRSLPETDAALLLPDDMGLLVQVFPVLQRVQVVAKARRVRLTGLDEQQVRKRAFRALRELLWQISDRTPILWFSDDLQWGDADSAGALFEVLRPPEAPVVLFLGAYRSDETETSPFLKAWEELKRKHDVQLERRDVSVGPLSVEQCTELVVALLGKDNDVIRRRAVEFAQEARGNPFLLIELVGCFDPATDSFHALPIHEVIRNKLGRLPADAEQLLEVVAVSGQALAVEEASWAAGQATAAVATLTHMRNERLIRLLVPEEKPLVDTYHDRIRETVLGHLQEGRSKILHLSLAEVIEKEARGLSDEQITALENGEQSGADGEQTIQRVYDLAYHFDAAGQKRKAWVYALLAAEQAKRQFAPEVAAEQYANAKRNAGAIANSARYRLAEGYGDVLMLLGRHEEANEQLHGVIDLVQDAERQARIEDLQGLIAFKQAAIGTSRDYYEQGLRRLGIWVPRTRLGFLFGLLRETIIQGVHSLLPFRLHRRPPSSQGDLTVQIFNHILTPYLFQNTLNLMWAGFSGMNRAELLPRSQHLAFCYACHSCFMAMLGFQSRASRYGERAMAMARDFNDVSLYGHCCGYGGVGLYASARYEEGIARTTEAIAASEKACGQWELHIAHFHKGCCHFGQGNLAEAVAEARWVFAASARLGDTRTLCSSWLWARATRGNIPFDELKSCYPCRPDDVMSTVHGVLAEGYWHSYHGRTSEALEAFEHAAGMVRKSFCINSHTILVLPMLAMGLRLHADAVQVKDAPQAEQLRKRAYRVAKWATRLTWLFPAAYPLALRERSLILAALGKTKKALKYADKSCAVAEKQKAKYEHAQSLLVRGKLAKELGLREADEQIRTAEAALDAIERPVREAATRQQATQPDSVRQKHGEPTK